MTSENKIESSEKVETKTKPTGLPPVPTTKVFAFAKLVAPLTPEQQRTLRPTEVSSTLRLYLEGKIDQWWYRTDGKGVIFLINAASVEEASQVLAKLPYCEAKLVNFEFMPVGPLAPLHALLGDTQ